MKFGEAWEEAAERDDERKRSWTNVSAALELAERKKGFESSKKEEKQTKDQFLLAATQRPLRFRSRLQYEGATARKDAEEDERSRWLHVPAGIVSNTDTPMGRLLRDKPGGVTLLGAGKRASTLRSRIRAVRKCVVWLSGAFAVSFPRDAMHVIEYLQMRLAEPSGRGAIKGAHQAMVSSKRCQGYQTRNAALRHRFISLRKRRSSQQLCRVQNRGKRRGSRWKSSSREKKLKSTCGCTPGGSWSSAVGLCDSRTTEGSRPQTSHWIAKDSRQNSDTRSRSVPTEVSICGWSLWTAHVLSRIRDGWRLVGS